MLKHVSYRASSTSLTRQFGNCRSSNTIGAHGKSPVSDVDSLISAPNSPHMYGRHSRHHSVTPESSPLTHDEVDGHKRHTIQAKLPVTSHTTLVTINSSPENPASSTCVVTQATDITYNRDNHVRPPPSTESSEDSLSLKADDPLSKHKNDLRCVDSMAVQAELMSDGAQRQHTDNSDNISLHSAISLTSLCRNDLRASTTSLSTSKVRFHFCRWQYFLLNLKSCLVVYYTMRQICSYLFSASTSFSITSVTLWKISFMVMMGYLHNGRPCAHMRCNIENCVSSENYGNIADITLLKLYCVLYSLYMRTFGDPKLSIFLSISQGVWNIYTLHILCMHEHFSIFCSAAPNSRYSPLSHYVCILQAIYVARKCW